MAGGEGCRLEVTSYKLQVAGWGIARFRIAECAIRNPNFEIRNSISVASGQFAICYLLSAINVWGYGREDHPFHGERMGTRRAL
jgi:hypothetical protein